MPGDPKKYKEHAERCLELASQAWDPVLAENLTQAAQRWARLADLANTSEILDKCGFKPEKQTGSGSAPCPVQPPGNHVRGT
jgi:hypothetical protein